jgi:hypothetical protein
MKYAVEDVLFFPLPPAEFQTVIMDGDFRDGADDIAIGGEGKNRLVWGLTNDGTDTLLLDSINTNVKQFYDSGNIDIQVPDDNGKPLEITDDMWDDHGNLRIPPGISGVITGPTGNTMTFTSIELDYLFTQASKRRPESG